MKKKVEVTVVFAGEFDLPEEVKIEHLCMDFNLGKPRLSSIAHSFPFEGTWSDYETIDAQEVEDPNAE